MGFQRFFDLSIRVLLASESTNGQSLNQVA
ncbi:hypothetical protein SAMN06273570_4033 [Candidatus Pantoea floridensis]|uniref:Uncharacterized protein n=1 Tax=Candidatus Pantoea floridensis TaxID=1938870 RepID=A0A286BZK8_9GAMM|nr:hypothetical protein BX596_1481 [Enterobacteriaceae bacterium JKS000233]SOD39583.1 hypothetical protein SAMN06273570_4033 [Pantoea floridensis]